MGSTGDKFDDLRNSIKDGDVLVPGSPGYDDSLKRWSETCILPAAVVVRPKTTAEVSSAVTFATSHSIPLVVRGGGHNTGCTSASDGGMVIDLAHLRSVSVDVAAQTVTFGGGCLWKDVDDAAWAHGLATVGGTVNDTGVGGLTLGGGYGFLTPRHGLACDNLVAAEVVLADGRIVNASADENADLFWALRGAGHSFGVVTRFTSRVHKQGEVWGGIMLLPWAKMPAVVKVANALHEAQSGNDMLLAVAISPPPAKELVMMCAVCHNGPAEEGEKVFAPLLEGIPPIVNHAAQRPYPQMNGMLGMMPSPPRRMFGGSNFLMPLTEEYVQRTVDEFLPWIKSKGIEDASGILFELIPNKKIQEVAIDGSAFAARGQMYQLGTMYQWADPALDGEIRAFNRQLIAKFKAQGIANDVGQYNNYIEEPLSPEMAFGRNVERLQRLKKIYDPNNVFWKTHNIVPKTESA